MEPTIGLMIFQRMLIIIAILAQEDIFLKALQETHLVDAIKVILKKFAMRMQENM